jgi:hypothetical protein
MFCGLDVAVDQAECVGFREGTAYPYKDVNRTRRLEWTVRVDQAIEVRPIEVFHRVVEDALRGSPIVEAHGPDPTCSLESARHYSRAPNQGVRERHRQRKRDKWGPDPNRACSSKSKSRSSVLHRTTGGWTWPFEPRGIFGRTRRERSARPRTRFPRNEFRQVSIRRDEISY